MRTRRGDNLTFYYVAAILVTAAAAWASSVFMAELRNSSSSGYPANQPDFGEVTIDWESGDWEAEPLYEIGQDGEPIYPYDTIFDDSNERPSLSGGMP